MVRKRPLVWYIFPTYLLVTLAVLGAITLYTTRSVREFYRAQIESDLWVRANYAQHIVDNALEEGGQTLLPLCRELGRETATRITVVLENGRVIADSEEDPAVMDNHAHRPEIAAALAGGAGTSARFSRTLQKKMMYAALPLEHPSEGLRGIVRVAVPVTWIREALWTINKDILFGGAIVAVFAAAISLYVSRRLSGILGAMERGAERFARGDFSKQLPIPTTREAASLAEALNQMARQLDDRIRTVINQRNQQEAILSSMAEGVLAVDTDERIISLNEGAAHLMGVSLDEAIGRSLRDIAHNVPLKQFVSRALESTEPTEGEFIAYDQDQRILQMHGTVLRDSQGQGIGAVVVMNDVTRLRRLEQVRRDFVANVSHELRTPITSIKGFVETLLDGALQDPEDARHFLSIVAKQADRLNAILADLLTLSRIEEGQGQISIQLAASGLCDTVTSAVQLCENKAEEKEVRVQAECDPALRAAINAPLLEQAVTNLVDNAIKYSDVGGVVRVYAFADDGYAVIRVEDRGCGIPDEHLPRLFERFYRVDKARSRMLGGTGLGLSIVKHIAQAHNGSVSVESAPGRGSTFSIRLPAAAEEPAVETVHEQTGTA